MLFTQIGHNQRCLHRSVTITDVILQYSFHEGYIVRSNARSRKRLNPTLFPRLSHAKPALSSRWDIMQRENDHTRASFHSYPGSPYAVSGKNARVI